MADVLSNEQLEKIKALSDAAVAGPWEIEPDEEYVKSQAVWPSGADPEGSGPRDHYVAMCEGGYVLCWSREQGRANAEYITAVSPDVVQSLIAEVQQYRGQST